MARSQQDVSGLAQQLDALSAQATQLQPPLKENITQVMPDVEKLVSSMAATFQGIIKSLVEELQPAQKNKYLAASVSLSDQSKSND